MVKDASQEAHPAALDGPEEARREVPDQTHRRALLEEAHGHAALHLEAVRGHGVHLVAAPGPADRREVVHAPLFRPHPQPSERLPGSREAAARALSGGRVRPEAEEDGRRAREVPLSAAERARRAREVVPLSAAEDGHREGEAGRLWAEAHACHPRPVVHLAEEGDDRRAPRRARVASHPEGVCACHQGLAHPQGQHPMAEVYACHREVAIPLSRPTRAAVRQAKAYACHREVVPPQRTYQQPLQEAGYLAGVYAGLREAAMPPHPAPCRVRGAAPRWGEAYACSALRLQHRPC